MKFKSLILCAILCSQSDSLFSQDLNAIFEAGTPISWLGLDFTKAKFTGDAVRFKDDDAVYKLIEDLNTLMLAESEKYNIPEAFEKTHVENVFDVTAKRNRTLKADDIRSDAMSNFSSLSEDDVKEIVAGYDFMGTKGIGLMFIIDNFNKVTVEGSMWITFVNMDTKKIILANRLTNKPVGFGVRNYWAGSIYGVLKKIKNGGYKTWKKKYYNK